MIKFQLYDSAALISVSKRKVLQHSYINTYRLTDLYVIFVTYWTSDQYKQ